MNITADLVANTAAATAGEKSGPQVRYKVLRAASWFEANGGLDPAVVETNRDRFLDSTRADAVVHDEQSREHWNWVSNKVINAAKLLDARINSGTPEKAGTRVLDRVVPNSPVDKAITKLMDAATSPLRLGVLRSDLSSWLNFLEQRGLVPEKASLVELEAFRSWLREPMANGRPRRAQPKQVLVPARKLTALLQPSNPWDFA